MVEARMEITMSRSTPRVIVLDTKGVKIKKGDSVLVHQYEGVRKSTVVDVPIHPKATVNEPGYWVDIDSGEGREGMMSYILEVIP